MLGAAGIIGLAVQAAAGAHQIVEHVGVEVLSAAALVLGLEVLAFRDELRPARGAASELCDRHDTERAWLAGRDVVVAVGGRPIALVEDVLHVELHAPHLVDLGIDRRVDADE